MKKLIALGISIGLLAGVFTAVSASVHSLGGLRAPLVVWVGFAAWACFYSAGGKAAGLGKTLGANATGLLWGWLIFWAATQLAPDSAVILGLCVAVGAFGMCVQARWSPLSFIPGAFVGAACYFGNGTVWQSTLISLVVGALLAYASEALGELPLRTGRTTKQPA
ncbi:DUF1097 domain-containing protein [Streptomyces caeruleatus]|uniref:DUF1097 domain-containing protein n=1 Tax=Streptomyces caeruleatus TaxID=661399 RepID=A0A117RS06_9ACTN|nr:DUF1097 domain-containing protein [Streptomyces caeruleatus]KUO06051.1 hypothetical protein AQJ67_04440 [Streptomyces caeruleatus]